MGRVSLTDEEQNFYDNVRYIAVTDHEQGQPYLAKAYWRLTPVASEEVDLMGVDQHWRVYINFPKVMKQGTEYAVKVLNHEIWHLLKKHHTRSEHLPHTEPYINQPLLINIANDLEINDDLKGLVPDDALYPTLHPFKLKEYETLNYYYDEIHKNINHYAKHFPDLIHKNRPDAPTSPQQDPDDTEGQPSPQNAPEPPNQGKQTPQGGEGQPAEQQQGGKPSPSAPKCGSASTGQPEPYELGEPSTKEQQEAGTTDADIETLLADVQKDIEEYAQEHGVGGSVGQVRDSLKKNEQKRKHIDWRKALRADLNASTSVIKGKTTYLRTKPSRRQPVPNVLYPALVSHKPTIGIAIDTSGSNLNNLYYILTEIKKITKSLNIGPAETKAFTIDVRAGKTKPVKDPLTLLDGEHHGGGTRMTPGYVRLAELNQDISILITDGEVYDYPKQKPSRTKTKYVTLIVPNGKGAGEGLLKKAEREIGAWSKVIVANKEQ